MNPVYNEAANTVANALEERCNANEISQFTALCEHLDKLTDAAQTLVREYSVALEYLDNAGEGDTGGGWDLVAKMEHLIDSTPGALFLRLVESEGWAGWPSWRDFGEEQFDEEEVDPGTLPGWNRFFNWTITVEAGHINVYLVDGDGHRHSKADFEAWEKEMERLTSAVECNYPDVENLTDSEAKETLVNLCKMTLEGRDRDR